MQMRCTRSTLTPCRRRSSLLLECAHGFGCRSLHLPECYVQSSEKLMDLKFGTAVLRGEGIHRAGPKVVKGEKKVSPYTRLLSLLLASCVVQYTSLA